MKKLKIDHELININNCNINAVITNTTTLLTWEVSTERVALEIRLYNVVSTWDLDQIENKTR